MGSFSSVTPLSPSSPQPTGPLPPSLSLLPSLALLTLQAHASRTKSTPSVGSGTSLPSMSKRCGGIRGDSTRGSALQRGNQPPDSVIEDGTLVCQAPGGLRV